jgi:hypothetical protein
LIAPTNANAKYDHDALNKQFEQMLPRIRLMSLHAFRDVKRELRYELVAEVVARAYAAYVRLAKQGRAHPGYATPLALFSIKQVNSGRRMGTKLNVNDISSPYAQLTKGINVARLDRYDDHQAAWKEVVVEDKRSGPAETAIVRIDFAAWLKTLSPKTRRIAKVLASGETTGGTARRFGVSPSRISQLRVQLKRAWHTFQGEPDKEIKSVPVAKAA